MLGLKATRPHARKFTTSFIVGGQGGAGYHEGQILIFPEGPGSVPETLKMYSEPLADWEAIPAGTERFDAAWYAVNTTPAPPPPAPEPTLRLADVAKLLQWTPAQLDAGKGHLPRPDGHGLDGAAWWRKGTIVRWRQALDVISGKAEGTVWGGR